MKKNYINNSFLRIFSAFLFSSFLLLYSCDNDINENLFTSPSKIWVSASVKANDTIKIFLGVTSGMNSGETAGYRDDATVRLYINNSDEPQNLIYKKINNTKGYYFNPDMPRAKPGDSLKFVGWIEGEDYEKVEAAAYIPKPVNIDSVSVRKANSPKNEKMKIQLEMMLDTSEFQGNMYFDLKMKNCLYIHDPKIPAYIQYICSKDNLTLSYGMYWNESIQSILVDYSHVKNNKLSVSFLVQEDCIKNTLEICLKTISREYYDYVKAVDNGYIVNSNIDSGSGIFTGYSESKKLVIIK